MLGSLFNAAYRAQVAADGSRLPDDLVSATQDSAAQGLDLAGSLTNDLAAVQTALVEHAVAIGFMSAMIAAALVIGLAAIAVWRWCPAEAGKAQVKTSVQVPTSDALPTPTLVLLLRASEARQVELEARIMALQEQQAELQWRCDRISEYVAGVELEYVFAPDPIAVRR
jgi:hypothetical protein